MPEVNIIDWHINPFRADRWYKVWMPALRRAPSFGAKSYSLTRAEDDHLHFVQTTIWESRADFERFWSSDEVSRARQDALQWYNKPLLPAWHVLLANESS